MPAPRKSIKQHELSGSLKVNPGRFVDRVDPPPPKEPIKNAPRHLTKEEQAVWRTIVNQVPEGLIGKCDALIVEVATKLTIKMQKGDFSKISDYTNYANILGKLGLTPGDRMRLNVSGPVEKEKSEWDDLDS